MAVDDFAPRLAFFFNGDNNVFQEVASSARAGRMWGRSCASASAQTVALAAARFHTETGGVTLTAQQPENKIARVVLQGFAAVCGGT